MKDEKINLHSENVENFKMSKNLKKIRIIFEFLQFLIDYLSEKVSYFCANLQVLSILTSAEHWSQF